MANLRKYSLIDLLTYYRVRQPAPTTPVSQEAVQALVDVETELQRRTLEQIASQEKITALQDEVARQAAIIHILAAHLNRGYEITRNLALEHIRNEPDT